jgi:tetratricopeptide (TPR) repeat protein
LGAAFLLPACASLADGSDPKEPGPPPLVREGWTFLASGRPEAAVACFERALASDPASGEARLGLGRAYEGLLESRSGSGTDSGGDLARKGIEAYLEALRLLPADPLPRLGAARLALRGGEVEDASQRAIEARALAEARGAPGEEFEANLLLARATLRRLGSAASPPAGSADAGALRRRAAAAIERSSRLEPLRPEPFELAADFAAASGDVDGCRTRLRRGVETCPEASSLHEKLQAAWAAGGPLENPSLLEVYDSLASARPDSPATQWYLGVARRTDADGRRRAQSWSEALAKYAAAMGAFERSASLDPGRNSAVQVAGASCVASRAWCRIGSGDLPGAARLFLDALRRSPSLLALPDAFGKTPREGIEGIVDAWKEGNELAAARDLLEKALAIAPGPPEWHARLGRLCRETGTIAETSREAERARALYEESFAAYAKALESSPEDPRLLVECAAVLLHHLGRDLDRAEEMLRRACDASERALADSSLPDARRDALSESLGDACEDLGVLYHDRRRDPQGARAFFEKSLLHALRPRPRVRWYLSKIEGGAATAESASEPPPR